MEKKIIKEVKGIVKKAGGGQKEFNEIMNILLTFTGRKTFNQFIKKEGIRSKNGLV